MSESVIVPGVSALTPNSVCTDPLLSVPSEPDPSAPAWVVRSQELEEAHRLDPDGINRRAMAAHSKHDLPKKKQRRKPIPKPPKDTKIYKTVLAYIALKAQGATAAEVGETLGLGMNTVRQYVYKAKQRGWINLANFADPEDQLDLLKSSAVRNVQQLLDTGESQGDKETTLELLKGTGMLKQHQVVKGETVATTAFALKVQVEMPPAHHPVQQLRAGSVGGTPSFDAEIIE